MLLAAIIVLLVVVVIIVAWPSNKPPSEGGCPSCPAGQTCNLENSRCFLPTSGGCPGGITLTAQPDSTVQIINNTSESPFHVFLEHSNLNVVDGKPPLGPPTDGVPWQILNASSTRVTLGSPVQYYPLDSDVSGPKTPPVAIGSATWQELIMPNRGDTAILKIPNFPKGAWSVRPLKYNKAGKPCQGSEGDCGMPILIESGKDMVGDMSAVDGVNFLLCYELTAKDGPTTIDFKTNPCAATGRNRKGCTNPSVDGIFDPKLVGTARCLPEGSDHCWLSEPCPAGTCNLIGVSKAWCNAVNDGQCANSSSQWSKEGQSQGGPESCAKHNKFTTYCYSHNDATSSPYFSSPYKMKLVYSDLV
jgi:hypothetical protein